MVESMHDTGMRKLISSMWCHGIVARNDVDDTLKFEISYGNVSNVSWSATTTQIHQLLCGRDICRLLAVLNSFL